MHEIMKKAFSLFLLLCLSLALTGCGDGKPVTALDGEALASELMDASVFSVPLTELAESKAGSFYSVDAASLKSAVMYHASGTSKEQIAVFEATDEKAAQDMAATLQGLVADWIDSDRDYAPDEVPKLESAVLRQSGTFVILVVADQSDAAAKIVGKYL